MTSLPQPDDGVTYAAKLTSSDSIIDWSQSAAALERQVRALNPWPGVSFTHDAMPIKILEARAVEGAGAPGTVVAAPLTIACGQGALEILRLQRPGKGPMAAADFVRGYAIPPGSHVT